MILHIIIEVFKMFEEEANSNLELKARLTEKLSKIEENA